MSLTPIIITPRKHEGSKERPIEISKKLINHLQLKDCRDLKILVGKTRLTTHIQTIESNTNEMIIPENILKEFCLPIQKYKLQSLYHLENHTLQLGPIIGLVTEPPSKKNGFPHFRSIHGFCEELQQVIGQNGGFFYVFSYDQFSTKGYYFENGKWIEAALPLPDVIYNRIHSRRKERSKKFEDFRSKLDQLMIPLFNDRFLSKWEVYEHIQTENNLLPFLPETKIFSKEHLLDFTQKYETVFLKPIHGSQGRNIFKISKESENRYSFQTSFTSLNENLENQYTLEEIYQRINPILQNRIYIIQQGIDLMTKESSAMDFRVLCHKKTDNHWKITSIVARIASTDEFVSNLARGGEILKPLDTLVTCMDQKKALEAFKLMKEVSLSTAAIVSRHATGITGELGIDIGVDKTGKPWIIEVNSKPSKSFEDDLGKVRPSAKAIIQYCTVLVLGNKTIKE